MRQPYHREGFMLVVRVVIFLLLCAPPASAQTFRGGIQGTVTDQTDAALPGVIVTATSVDTGLSRSVDTDASGNYFLSELPLGEYTVSASLPGFAPQTVKAVEVEASRSRRVDIQLHPGGGQESVEVVAGSRSSIPRATCKAARSTATRRQRFR
jgi:hypothetical protein